MLISRNIRKKLTVLAVGTGLFAGCSSGPQLSSVRFFPGGDKLESAADDEAVAQKWRDRLNESALSGGTDSSLDVFDVARTDKAASKPRSGRFNLFRLFSRKENEAEAEAPQPEESVTIDADRDRQRLALERRIAQLESEQQTLQRKRASAGTPSAAPFDPTKSAGASDPFLAAAQQKRIVRPVIRPAPQEPASQANLPSWAQVTAGQNSSPTTTPAGRELLDGPKTNALPPEFDHSLNRLEASIEKQPFATPTKGTAPALPFADQPTITTQPVNPAPDTSNPFAVAAQKALNPPVASPPTDPFVARTTQPKLDNPVTAPGAVDQTASLRSVEDQQQAWANLEVQQLMKRSRIQARAGQLREALATALAAEQLANSADIPFSDREQTPAQLVSLIRLRSNEAPSTVVRTESKPYQETANDSNLAKNSKLTGTSMTPRNFVAQKLATKTVAPPQWPGRRLANEPRQVVADSPLISSSSVDSNVKNEVKTLRTAEFTRPRPVQSVEPRATTSDQWYSTANHPLTQTPQNHGHYIEAPTTPRRSHSGIKAQFASSETIYSPENLQWSKLEDGQATILGEGHVPVPPSPIDVSTQQEEHSALTDDRNTASDNDPFADVFDQSEVSDTLLSSDAPMTEFAPSIPTSENIVETELSFFSIPARKLGLVALAGLILLAAVVHRRRTNDLHEL